MAAKMEVATGIRMEIDRDSRFWDGIAERYAKKPLSDPARYQKKLALTQTYLQADMELLELGCGTGSTALAHAPFVRHVLATDISEKMLEIARGKAAESGVDNVAFERMSVEQLGGMTKQYDMVLALSLLHLVDDWRMALTAIGQRLKPNGVLVLNTACLGDGMSYFRYIAPIGRALGLLPHLRVFSADDLAAGLDATGFDIEHDWRLKKGVAVFMIARKRTAPR